MYRSTGVDADVTTWTQSTGADADVTKRIHLTGVDADVTTWTKSIEVYADVLIRTECPDSPTPMEAPYLLTSTNPQFSRALMEARGETLPS